MQTFTVRDLDRNPKKVLDSCLEQGSAVVRSRGGRSYLITLLPEPGQPDPSGSKSGWLSDHRKWLARKPHIKIPASQVSEVDRLVGGE